MIRRQHVSRALAGFVVAISLLNGHAQRPQAAGEWRYYSGDMGSTKYAPLDQISHTNVKDLRIAWRRPAVDDRVLALFPKRSITNYHRTTPLMAGGVVYAQNGVGLVEALHPATGMVSWVQEPRTGGLDGLNEGRASRGVAYWQEGEDRRILTVRGNYLFALDAKTGKASR